MKVTISLKKPSLIEEQENPYSTLIPANKNANLSVVCANTGFTRLNILENAKYINIVKIDKDDEPNNASYAGAYLDAVYLQDDMSSFASSAFRNATTLKEIHGNGITDLPSDALNGDLSCTFVDFPHLSSIGAKAFNGCKSLKDISFTLNDISSSFEKTGAQLFEGCESLSNDVSLNISAINSNNAFRNCKSIPYADLPNVESFSNNCFYGCSKLSSVNFPKCKKLGAEVFGSCTSLVSAENNVLSTIPASTFANNYSLSSVRFDNCLSIYPSAFSQCSSLTYADFPSVRFISTASFNGTSSLLSINFPDLSAVNHQAFYNCNSLSSISAPNLERITNDSTSNIGTFENCKNLSSILFESLSSIGANAFRGCSSLTTIDIPNLEYVGDSAFKSCESLSSLTLPKLKYGKFASNFKTVSTQAFANCSNLKDVSLPEALDIGRQTFLNCGSLSSVYLPILSSLYGSGDLAGSFANCSSLVSVDLPSIVSMNGCIFGPSKIRSFDFGHNLSSFDPLIFMRGYRWTSAYGGGGTSRYINEMTYEDQTVEDEHRNIIQEGDHFEIRLFSDYTDEQKTATSSDADLTIYNQIKDDPIPKIKYSNNDDVGKFVKIFKYPMTKFYFRIFVPASKYDLFVNDDLSGWGDPEIKSHIFKYGQQMFPQNKEITRFYSDYSSSNKYFAEMDIDGPVSVTDKKLSSDLTKVEFGTDVTEVSLAGFKSVKYLSSVVFTDNVERVNSEAFYGCTGLKSISLPDSIEFVGSDVFYNCTQLSSVRLPVNAQYSYLAERTFYNCRQLSSLTIPENIERIGEQAFYYCSSLSSLTIPYNVRYIAQNAFQSCSKLKSVTFEDKTMNDPLLPYDLENKHWGLYKGCVLHYVDGDITIS